MKILISGHLGFIGSGFCELYAKEHEIIGIDNHSIGSDPSHEMGIALSLEVDIRDRIAVTQLVANQKPDAIINFAAESHVDRSNVDTAPFITTNVCGAAFLAVAAKSVGARFLQVSTDEVYGSLTYPLSATEGIPPNPSNPYARSKWLGEEAVKAVGGDWVITRGANTIGPRQNEEKAVPKAIKCFLTGQTFPLFRTKAYRMWMYVEDHCRGIMAALQKGKGQSIYNLGSDYQVATDDLIFSLQHWTGGSGRIEIVADRANYDLRYSIDSFKANLELGWETTWAPSAMISETVKWYRANKPEWRPIQH